MWNRVLAICRRASRVLPVLLLGACATYEGGWAYVPDRSVHQTVLDGPTDRATVAQVTAHVVGILRAREDQPRRLHVRLTVDNFTDAELQLLTAETQVTTGLPEPHPCMTTTPVAVPGHDQRWLDLMFLMPDRRTAPRDFLKEITLSWVLEQNGVRFTSEAPFQRVPQPSVNHYWHGSWMGVWEPWPYWHRGYVRWTVYPRR